MANKNEDKKPLTSSEDWILSCKIKKEKSLGRDISSLRDRARGVFVTFSVNHEEGWCSVFTIESSRPNHGNAQFVLAMMKDYYEHKGYSFGSTIPLNDKMAYILRKLEIPVFG